MNGERCPNCHKHCKKEHLSCDRGRRFFNLQPSENQMSLLNLLEQVKQKFDIATDKNAFFSCLTECETAILTLILQKIRNER